MKIFSITTTLLLFANTICAQAPFKTGINFPFRDPNIASINDFISKLDEAGAKSMRQLAYADVYWRIIEPTDNNWNWTFADSAFNNNFGITPIPELFALMGPGDTIGIQVPWLACTSPSCYWDLATDSVSTKDYLFNVINRYKGVTKYWEIANEFESALPPTGLSPIAKVNFLNYTYNWIKDIDTAAQVLFPGLIGTCGIPFSNATNNLDILLSNGGANSFDIMNYHDYNSWWTLPLHYDSIKSVMNNYGLNNIPIWVTETSISSVNQSPITPTYSSEDEQAADVFRRLGLLWAKGAEVVMWHSNWSSSDLNGWGEFGLLNAIGKKKKAFHSYRLLNDKVTNFTNVTALQYGNITDDNLIGGDGVWAIQFTVNGAKKWMIWSPDNQTYNLNGISSSEIIVTEVVPTMLQNLGELASFQVDTTLISGGNHLFSNLSSLPILVEEYDAIAASILEDFTNQLNLYPNPVKQKVQIDFQNFQEKLTLEITTISGKTIQRTRYSGLEKLSIDLTTLSSGIYFLKVTDNNNKASIFKILKE